MMLFEWVILVLTVSTGFFWFYIFYGKRKHTNYAPSKFADHTAGFFPVLLVVFILRSFIIEPFRIPSGSMTPNLLDGDFIFVNKHSFGVRLPIAGKRIFGSRTPERGEMVVFRLPSDPSIVYVKRVIGLPGDEVFYDYQEKELWVNDHLVENNYVGNYADDSNLALMQETYGSEHRIIHMNSRLSPGGLYNVPEGHYFMMGDNRDNSQDSRFSVVGFVPEDNLVGKPVFIWMHWNNEDEDAFKWERLGFIEG